MNDKKVTVALDIGTTKVCTLVALQQPNAPLEIIGIGSSKSRGLKKGSVVNIDDTIDSISQSIEEAKLMAGVDFYSATIGIAGNHIYDFNSSGAIPIKHGEITEDDVLKALEAAKAVVIPSDREILHAIPREFKVDNTVGIKNPVGMCGVRLEVETHIVTGSVTLIQNLVKCVEASGIEVNDIILQPLASSESVLSREEKEMGVVLVDIGGGTTDVAMWIDGSICHSQIIPVGGNHFTNDVAIALKVSGPEAEEIKISQGNVLREKINQNSMINLRGLSGTRERKVESTFLAEVLGARAEELFNVIDGILVEQDLKQLITGGVVLTGGGAQIQNLSEMGEYIIEMPCKLGMPTGMDGMTTLMHDPKYSTVLGLLKIASRSQTDTSDKSKNSLDIMSRLGESFKSVFKEIF